MKDKADFFKIMSTSFLALLFVTILSITTQALSESWFPTGPWRIHTQEFDEIFADTRSKDWFYANIASLNPDHKYYQFCTGCSGGATTCTGDEPYLGKFVQAKGDCSNFRYYSACQDGWTYTRNCGFYQVNPADEDGDGIADFEDLEYSKNNGPPICN